MDNFCHFPPHDIPGAARPKKPSEGVPSWTWEHRRDATAVAGHKLSVLYSTDSRKPPYYPSTKSLAVLRGVAGEEVALFKDVPLQKDNGAGVSDVRCADLRCAIHTEVPPPTPQPPNNAEQIKPESRLNRAAAFIISPGTFICS